MASRFPETPCNVGSNIGISGRRLFINEGKGHQDRSIDTDGQFVRIEPAKCTVTTLPKEANTESASTSSTLDVAPSKVVQKRATKYNPPDFIRTVKVMREKLYSMYERDMYEDEPPKLDNAAFKDWKRSVQKEPWYTTDNVSTFLVTYKKYKCF